MAVRAQTNKGFPVGRAILGGLIGSVVMAMWAMMVAGATGMGFWAPVQLIAATWYGPAAMMHLTGGVIIAGLMTHMMMGAMLGIILAIAFQVIPAFAPGRVRLVWGIVYGLVVWIVMQFAILKAVDPMMASKMTPWAFAMGHMMFGLVAAAFLLTRPTVEAVARSVRAS
ncbi:MAG: hypothetical protein ACP5QO_07865 [Clostridia bacterium]